jgi:cyclopropane-fatty-acyl-phospholipid synthase
LTIEPHAVPPSSAWTGPAPHQELYRPYSAEEDRDRTNVHYEHPTEFFTQIVGGEWHTYSCNLWSPGGNATQSQERKLDLLAELMQLAPGQRILEVGSGWGGPLVYLCQKYGVRGVGLTLSPTQRAYAERRIEQHGIAATIVERHWQEFEDDEGFDAVFTDEVLAHINDFDAFCRKADSLLQPGGHFLNKELHFTNSRYKTLSRAATFIHELYGLAGYYRTLGEELVTLDRNGFSVDEVNQIPREQYRLTADDWLANMRAHELELRTLVGDQYYRQFRVYLKLVRKLFTMRTMTIDVVSAVKL